eukprot:2312628-Prymnesium_polylepis.1
MCTLREVARFEPRSLAGGRGAWWRARVGVSGGHVPGGHRGGPAEGQSGRDVGGAAVGGSERC